MDKAKMILEGYTNLLKSKLFPSDSEIEELSKKRMVICNSCSHLKTLKTCGKCGCYMPAKTRSVTANCPLKYW